MLADEFGLGTELVERLAQTERVVQVRVANAFSKVDAESYELRPNAREDLDALLDDLREAGTVPSRIVHMWSVVSDETPTGIDALPTSQARGFYSLLFLAQALGEKLTAESVSIEVVTNDLFGVLVARPCIRSAPPFSGHAA